MMVALRISDRHWWMIIVMLWVSVTAAPNFKLILPASYWFSVDQVHVFDTTTGQSPLMAVERTIRRPFKARWIAEVERWNGSRFILVSQCTGRGENNYSPENDLPDPLRLDWWIYPATCDLAPGQYRVETRWELSGGQQVRALSNIFMVK